MNKHIRIKMKKILSILILLTVSLCVSAQLRLGSLFTDNMVLQQNADAKIWGLAAPKADVVLTPSWSRQIVSVKADKNGRWEATVKTLEASFDAYDLTISTVAGKGNKEPERITLHNILFGEVWLASGQSNMEMPLEGFGGCCVKDGAHDAMRASAEAPYVRMFTVKKAQTMKEQQFCEGTWEMTKFPKTLRFSATAYYFARALTQALNCPVGIVNSSYGGAHVEGWMPKSILETYPDVPTDSVGIYNAGAWDYDRPMLMYNAMFCPVKDFTYKGIIWYQGCSNVGHADVYAERLATMVKHWRSEIGCGDIPFYEVEIAPYEYGDGSVPYTNADNKGGLGALIREAQMQATELIPNSGIVGTNDAVEPYEQWNIHPSKKYLVGERLAFMALNRTYGMHEVFCDAPRAVISTFRVLASKDLPAEVKSLAGCKEKIAAIVLDGGHKGICRTFDLSGFEIAGADKVFHPCRGEFRWQSNEIFLASPDVPEPVAIRYCFRDWKPGGIVGGNELPLFPFRTDKW